MDDRILQAWKEETSCTCISTKSIIVELITSLIVSRNVIKSQAIRYREAEGIHNVNEVVNAYVINEIEAVLLKCSLSLSSFSLRF